MPSARSLWRYAFASLALLRLGDAAATVVVTITGRKATADITLPGPGASTYTADLELEFDNPQNLTAACLGISADVLDGDQTHFAREDSVEESWRIVERVLEDPPKLVDHPRGSWGPETDDAVAWLPCGPRDDEDER